MQQRWPLVFFQVLTPKVVDEPPEKWVSSRVPGCFKYIQVGWLRQGCCVVKSSLFFASPKSTPCLLIHRLSLCCSHFPWFYHCLTMDQKVIVSTRKNREMIIVIIIDVTISNKNIRRFLFINLPSKPAGMALSSRLQCAMPPWAARRRHSVEGFVWTKDVDGKWWTFHLSFVYRHSVGVFIMYIYTHT